MKITDLMKAQRQSGKPPTMPSASWSAAERERIKSGLCVLCGQKPPAKSSYICRDCEGRTTIEDIQDELDAVRRKILGSAATHEEN